MNNTAKLAFEKQEDFILGDAVVYQDKSNPFNHSIFFVEVTHSDRTVQLFNQISGYEDKVSIQDIRHATITEIKNKKRGAEAVALFVSDVDLHLERAIQAQSEVT